MKTCILIVGESGSGKDSLTSLLEKDGYKVLKSYSTRPKREGEGDTHIFITDEDVPNYRDDIIAYTRIGSYQYFSTKQQIMEADIYTIDPKGVQYLKTKMYGKIRPVTIYINVPMRERLHRARKRKDNEDEIIKRFTAEQQQFDEFRTNADFDYSISNMDLDKAYRVLKHIVEVEMEEVNEES